MKKKACYGCGNWFETLEDGLCPYCYDDDKFRLEDFERQYAEGLVTKEEMELNKKNYRKEKMAMRKGPCKKCSVVKTLNEEGLCIVCEPKLEENTMIKKLTPNVYLDIMEFELREMAQKFNSLATRLKMEDARNIQLSDSELMMFRMAVGNHVRTMTEDLIHYIMVGNKDTTKEVMEKIREFVDYTR